MNLIKVQENNKTLFEFLANFTSEHTRKSYAKDIKKFVEFSGVTDVSQIQLINLITYRDFLKAEKASPATINRRLSSIKSLLSWCKAQGLIATNPGDSLKLSKVFQTQPTLAFSDQEVLKLLDEVENKKHALVLAILLNLGLRRSELTGLKWTDVMSDRGHRVIRVVGKGNKQRTLPITDNLWKYFEDYAREALPSPDDYVAGGSQPMNPATVYKIVRKYADQAGITKRVGAHSCRATVISHLLEKSVSPRNVADFAGHSSINTTVSLYDKKRDGITNSAAYKVGYESQDQESYSSDGSVDTARGTDSSRNLRAVS